MRVPHLERETGDGERPDEGFVELERLTFAATDSCLEIKNLIYA